MVAREIAPAEYSAQTVLDGLYLFSNSSLADDLTVKEFCDQYVNALVNGKVVIQYDENDKPTGCNTYCFLTDEQASLMTTTGFWPSLEDYQREDGDQLWVFWTVSIAGRGVQQLLNLRKWGRKMYGKRPVYFVRDIDFHQRLRRGTT